MRTWPDAHCAELKRLTASGVKYKDAAISLNAQFGTSYTIKACIGRANRMKYSSTAAKNTPWPIAHLEALKELIDRGYSYSHVTARLNHSFGTNHSRNAYIGQMTRFDPSRPRVRKPGVGAKELGRRYTVKRRERRWAEQPRLAELAQRREAKKQREASLRVTEAAQTRVLMRATQTPKTAACYRKHLPRLPEMTKTELRAMLSRAVRNTAAMGVS